MDKEVQKVERKGKLKVLVQISTSDEDSFYPYLISYIPSKTRNFTI